MTVNSTEEWYWKEGILVCKLLSQWSHGFFTRSHAPQAPKELQKYFNSDLSNPSFRTYHAKQVHGDLLVDTTEFIDSILPEADGVFASSNLDPISVWTCSADCVPILIGDRALGTVAAIHGGWRGTAKGILIKAIGKFQENGSDLANLLVAFGPAISGASYQVQTSVAEQVLTTIKNPVGVSSDDLIGHCRLDIRLVQQQQLLELGLSSSQIAIAPHCTFQTPEHFFSYRRNTLENLKAENSSKQVQIQWSGIKSNINLQQR
jgi:polyphenol oxidase